MLFVIEPCPNRIYILRRCQHAVRTIIYILLILFNIRTCIRHTVVVRGFKIITIVLFEPYVHCIFPLLKVVKTQFAYRCSVGMPSPLLCRHIKVIEHICMNTNL